MADPQTVNTGLFIPAHGTDVDTWDQPLNNDYIAIDGYLGGVTTISASSSPITLTAPSGFTATPSAGPTQAQNAVLKFTGTLTANVQVTLPLPGYYIVSNQTTGNFVLSFRAAGVGDVIGVDQQDDIHIYSDGTNVRFVNLGRIGHTEMWAGLTTIPAWVAACTKRPYLLCDGFVYNFSDFPSLAQKLKGQFGGNGITTFAVPDSGGRIQLPYDTTGARITSAVCGINGQTIGAAGGDQNVQQHTHVFTGALDSTTQAGVPFNTNNALVNTSAGSQIFAPQSDGSSYGRLTLTPTGTNANYGTGSSQNVQPAQVTGIMVIRAG